MRLKILPFTIGQFQQKYNVSNNGLAFAYGKYLLTNIDVHHYGTMNIKEWYKNQINTLNSREYSSIIKK